MNACTLTGVPEALHARFGAADARYRSGARARVPSGHWTPELQRIASQKCMH